MPKSSARRFSFSASFAQFRDHFRTPFWQRRLVELSILCRIVELENPKLAKDCELKRAHRRLRAARGSAAEVARSPEFLLWINTARFLILRGMHQALPVGHVREHFGDLRRFAFAAACADGASTEELVRVQADGRISLPGLAVTLFAGRHNAGREARLITDGKSVAALTGMHEFKASLHALPQAFAGEAECSGWRLMPRLGWQIILTDALELSGPHRANNLAWRIRYLSRDDVAQWSILGRQALELLAAVEKQLSIPVRDVLASVVPLQSTPQVNISGTCDQVLGCICTSLPLNAAILAETLVHEAAHVTLHIITDQTAYWRDGGHLYRSPWRRDLRPISGMIHGIFAFLAVAEFWAAALASGQAEEFEALGRFRLRTATRQVQRALAELKNTTELTEAGQHLFGMAIAKNESLKRSSRAFKPAAADARIIEERIAQHETVLAAPSIREAPHGARSLDCEWSNALGAEMPPPVNDPSARIVRRETITDYIHCAALNNDPLVDDWQALLRKTAETEPESALLVRGSISYGQGDFSSAVASYAAYVERRWHDMDAWRLLGAALRRAGRPDDALAIAFDFDSLQQMDAADLRGQFGADWPRKLHRISSA